MPKETNKQTPFTQPLQQMQKLIENEPHRPDTKQYTTNFLEKIEGKIFVTSGRQIFLIHNKYQKQFI